MKYSSPEQSGFSSAGLKRLDALFGSYINEQKLVGVSATVARRGQTFYREKFGNADTKPIKPIEFDTIFRIASMTKPITSVAAMLLYEEGKFHLNTPVHEFIPGFKSAKVLVRENGEELEVEDLKYTVTMRHLFTHTSGLSYGFDPNHPIDRRIIALGKTMEHNKIEPDGDQIVAEMLKLPLSFQPGSRWRYGMNIEVLGHIIEIISGQNLANFMAERIFEPLGMTDTGFYVPSEKRDRLAAIYGRPSDPSQLERLDIPYPTELPRFQSGGGGLASTLPDYSRFCQMLVNKGELDGVRLLSPKTVAMYATNQCPEQALPYGFLENDLYHAGYGYSLATRVLMSPSKTGVYGSAGEFGWDGAFGTYFWVDPVEELFGLMMIQFSPNAYYQIAPQFKQTTYAAMLS